MSVTICRRCMLVAIYHICQYPYVVDVKGADKSVALIDNSFVKIKHISFIPLKVLESLQQVNII